MKSNVTAIISTRDRYFTTLPQTIIAVTQQTVKPEELIIYDDGEQIDLRKEPVYENIFKLLDAKGIKWKVLFGARIGQVANHQRSIADTKTEWIWRLDDDVIMEPDVLEKLLANRKPGVGAIAGLIIDPKIGLKRSELASNKIEDIYIGMNEQWFKWVDDKPKEVDHLYSSFIYKKSAAKHGYCKELSRVGHREETIFTHEMKRAGWKLLIVPTAINWHMRASTGGIRAENNASLWQSDERVFARKLVEWGVKPNQPKLVILNSGLGDHLVFKNILPELKKKHKNIILAVCYREVFPPEEGINIMSIAEAQMLTNDTALDNYNIYKFMADRNWTKPLEDAYREMYGVPQ